MQLSLIFQVSMVVQTFENRQNDHMSHSFAIFSGNQSFHCDRNETSVLPACKDSKQPCDQMDDFQRPESFMQTLLRTTLKARGCEVRINVRALAAAWTWDGRCALRIALSISEGTDFLYSLPSSFHTKSGRRQLACCGGYVKAYFTNTDAGHTIRAALDLMSTRTDISAPEDLAKLVPADCNHRHVTSPCLSRPPSLPASLPTRCQRNPLDERAAATWACGCLRRARIRWSCITPMRASAASLAPAW